MAKPVTMSALPFPLVRRGKVRDVYDVGQDRLLIVATDRISAFDVVMSEPIPHKGAVLTSVTMWWLDRLEAAQPHHLMAADADAVIAEVPALASTREQWEHRSMLVRRTTPLPVECVVRGYISGSAWAEYRRSGTLAGEPLQAGLRESDRLDPPIFSPATKAEEGHDENITFAEMERIVGAELAAALRDRSIALYEQARAIAEQQANIIVADTKFEFGIDAEGRLLLIDEVLTPDSSRFWPKETYEPDRGQPSLDKQPVRDFLEELTSRGEWNKQAPPPSLPETVVTATSDRYLDLWQRLTGQPPLTRK